MSSTVFQTTSEALRGERHAELLAYWKQQLAGCPSGLDLPTDRPRTPTRSHRSATCGVLLPKDLADALYALSHQEGVTLFMLLVAALQTLLSRYTGQEDVVIGSVVAGDAHAARAGLVGPFANTLVLRTDMSGDPTFRMLLGHVRAVVQDALAHQALPFETLVKTLEPEREGSEASQNPFFQVMLSLRSALALSAADWTVEPVEAAAVVSTVDLHLEVEERAGGLFTRFTYSVDLFDQVTIRRMAGHWQTLLAGVVADPEQHLSALPLLTEQERQQLLVEWNATESSYPKEQCIHQLFEEQVERTPEAIAVVFEDEQLTYRQLNQRANQLAHYLRDLGVGPDILVGLCVERSQEMVVGLLGILKAGGAYVPLDPAFPPERLAFMLEDAQVPVLVAQSHLTDRLPVNAQIVCLDSDQAALAKQCEANLPSAATASNLAYVIYTSGSTGRPKGVQILHRAVVNFLLSMREWPGMIAEDILLAVTTLSFDIAALELFLPLLVGARVVIARRDVVMDGVALIDIMTRTHTTVMQATPITWRILLAAGWQGHPHLKILCGGEALSWDLAQQLLPKAASLWNLYGPTETTIWSSVCKIERGVESISIGRPIANTQFYILDRHRQPVPIGVPGELLIGGDGLARGYLNRPELTSERFFQQSFGSGSEVRLYRTGDVARYRADGSIEHRGRLDFQVKVRGFRIELGEIEAVLAQHPAVRQAVVVVREDTPGDRRLVAYVVLKDGQQVTREELKSQLSKQVPAYMVPSAFMWLETVPLTPNGKVDRKALPAPEASDRTAQNTYVAPTLPLHHQVVQIWEELLGVQPIGITDDFFELGGHSLLAIRMMERVAQVSGKKLPFSILTACSTIEHLTTALTEDAKTASRVPFVTVQAGGSKPPFFYLHGEWKGGAYYSKELARQLGPDQPFYLLEPYKFDRVSMPPSYEAMAAAHLKTLQSIQSEGPYLLGGYCNGGLIAYEMARQLHAQGQKIALLVLMDPDPPGRHHWVRRVISDLGRLMRIGQQQQFEAFIGLQHLYRYLRFAHYRKSKIAELLETDKQRDTERQQSPEGHLPFNLRLKALVPDMQALRQEYPIIYHWVVADYTPGLYPGKITFFWTNEEPWRSVGWRTVTKAKEGEVEIHSLPGNHITSRTEHLQVLTEHLCDCVNRAQDRLLR